MLNKTLDVMTFMIIIKVPLFLALFHICFCCIFFFTSFIPGINKAIFYKDGFNRMKEGVKPQIEPVD